MPNLAPLVDADYEDDAVTLGCKVIDIKTVASVETSGSGFDPEGFPRTLFEGHHFYRLTKGKFATSNPTLCYPTWTNKFYGKTWKEEKARLQTAMTLDRDAALQSASWGMFQIMGFNYVNAGFTSVQGFVNAMCASENDQLAAFTQLLMHWKLNDELRDHKWADFARVYNGSGQVDYYATKLKAAYDKLTKG